MPSKPILAYWDANLFLHYIGNTPGRIEIIEALIAQARSGEAAIATSTLSLTEAACSADEMENGKSDPLVEAALDDMFSDHSLLTLVEYDRRIAIQARTLMRRALSLDRSLKPADAIHLASAEHVGASFVYSYDARLAHVSRELGTVMVREPSNVQLRLPGMSPAHDTE